MNQPISSLIWDLKYRYRLNGKEEDQCIEDTWQRVARAIARPEKLAVRARWQREFYDQLEGFQFLPGGRILAGAGTKHQVTLFNCFVMDIPNDSLKGIFEALLEGALTLQQGGGVGYDFSVLRPAGDLVKKTGLTSSGPVSFMRIWDTTCGILLSTGMRRGAMMGVMRCDHPDIEAFIEAKRDPHELRHFNVSVLVTDAFMQAVKSNADWPLRFPAFGDKCKTYRTVKAKALWEKIIRSAYDYAEPGVIFGDTVNRCNNLWYTETIHATNPCGEIPLPAYGACDLGSINLTQCVVAPFTDQAKIDWNKIDKLAHVGTRFLDNVIDVSRYPLHAQRKKAESTRRIGLGVTGLADLFVMLGMRYGSPESVKLASEMMKRISEVSWYTSIELAKEKGVFPAYQLDYLKGAFVQTLSDSLRRQLSSHGVRNSHHNTIAPTGTISLLANNVSNGIEPIFRAEYVRHVRLPNDELATHTVQDYAYGLWQTSFVTSPEPDEGVRDHSVRCHPEASKMPKDLPRLRRSFGAKDAPLDDKVLPPAWVDAHALTPDEHLSVQAAMQPYIDNAISKTINIPSDFPFEQLEGVYTRAYELGLKGCTVFRPNPITGNVLEEKHDSTQQVDRCCQLE